MCDLDPSVEQSCDCCLLPMADHPRDSIFEILRRMYASKQVSYCTKACRHVVRQKSTRRRTAQVLVRQSLKKGTTIGVVLWLERVHETTKREECVSFVSRLKE